MIESTFLVLKQTYFLVVLIMLVFCYSFFKSVFKGGFEPPTGGFSINCSTTELFKH